MNPEERRAHCRRIAALGGRATAEKHGREYMAEIGKRGFARAMEEIGGEAVAALLAASYQTKYGRPIERTTNKPKKRADHRKRQQARQLYPSASCELCGAPAERHHVNGLRTAKTGDVNAPENIRHLCRQHHIEEHRRQRCARRNTAS